MTRLRFILGVFAMALVTGVAGCRDSGGDIEAAREFDAFPLYWVGERFETHLSNVARAPILRRRRIRGAPVGTIDSAPVLFTRGAQVTVYRGEACTLA
jgi:hypothetical protein